MALANTSQLQIDHLLWNRISMLETVIDHPLYFRIAASHPGTDILSEAVRRMLSGTAILMIEHVKTGPKLMMCDQKPKASEHQSESYHNGV